jgi:hypothetical protein
VKRLIERRSQRSAALAVEDDLMLCCSRSRLDPATRERVYTLSAGEVDWPYVTTASTRHGVAPLVYRSLQDVTSNAELLPGAAQALDGLAALHAISRKRNNRLSLVLRETVTALRGADVAVLALKDVQLAFAVYPDPALRPLGDIDLLVRREDYTAAARALGELGFRPRAQAKPVYGTKYALAHMFHRQIDNTFVDLQWNVLQREWDPYAEGTFRHDIDAMWASARLEHLAGTALLVPSPEHMLFHLCLHLEGHGLRELVLFSDIVELVEHYGESFDWDELVRLTVAHGACSSVFYVLRLTECLFGLRVPPAVLARLRPAYFQAPLYNPLFGNLTSLHGSLDEANAVAPAAEALDKFELIARVQAAQAMNVFRELDRFAIQFVGDGGRLILFDGTPSARLFPDTRIPAFQRLRGIIAGDDLALARHSLLERGFREDGDSPGTLRLSVGIDSKDPVLAGRREEVELRVTIAQSSADAFGEVGTLKGNRSAALQSIGARFQRTPPSLGATVVSLVLCPLTETEIVAWICYRLGSRMGESDVITDEQDRHDRLFVLGEALAAANDLPGPADLDAVRDAAEQHSVTEEVERGLLLAQAVIPLEDPLVEADPRSGRGSAPRIFLWARQGPGSDRQQPALRPLFFYFMCLLATPGIVGKARLLARSVLGGRGSTPTLPPLLLRLVTAAIRSLRRGDAKPSSDAYWLEG